MYTYIHALYMDTTSSLSQSDRDVLEAALAQSGLLPADSPAAPVPEPDPEPQLTFTTPGTRQKVDLP